MKLSPGELVDKWSIIHLKAQVDPNLYADLYHRLTKEVYKLTSPKFSLLMPEIAKIIEANTKIWMLESGLRNGVIGHGNVSIEELAAIGKLAIQIREINKIRVRARSAIDVLTGHIPDKKYDHLSQDEQS